MSTSVRMIRKALNQPFVSTEKNLIDEDLLKRRIQHDMFQKNNNRENHPGEESDFPIKFERVSRLCLDLENLVNISNMWRFRCLQKLRLSMNKIQKIEGLESLRQLKSLDLSFNIIKKIEGLENLTQLEDLMLSHNSIEEIENIEKLDQLTFFTIGYNLLRSLENVRCLRFAKNLKALEIKDNPLEGDGYEHYILAHLPQLEYMNGRMVGDKLRQDANDKYRLAISELEAMEKNQREKREAEEENERRFRLLKEANVEQFDGVFSSIFECDQEGRLLLSLPNAANPAKTYEEQLNDAATKLIDIGLAELARRKEAIEECRQEIQNTRSNSNKEKMQVYDSYKAKKSKMVNKMTEDETSDAVNEADLDLEWPLLRCEESLLNSSEEIIVRFDAKLKGMVVEFEASLRSVILQCKELDEGFAKILSNELLTSYDDIVQNLDARPDKDKLGTVLKNKESLTVALTMSHRRHLDTMDLMERDVINRTCDQVRSSLDEIKNTELMAHRLRLKEIMYLLQHEHESLETIRENAG